MRKISFLIWFSVSIGLKVCYLLISVHNLFWNFTIHFFLNIYSIYFKPVKFQTNISAKRWSISLDFMRCLYLDLTFTAIVFQQNNEKMPLDLRRSKTKNFMIVFK